MNTFYRCDFTDFTRFQSGFCFSVICDVGLFNRKYNGIGGECRMNRD